MGTFKPEFVIGVVLVSERSDDLDRFVAEHPRLFTKSGELVNGYINYVMFWDGSKEGWDESNEADRLRETFIELLKKIEYTRIYHIEHHEGVAPSMSWMYVFKEEEEWKEWLS